MKELPVIITETKHLYWYEKVHRYISECVKQQIIQPKYNLLLRGAIDGQGVLINVQFGFHPVVKKQNERKHRKCVRKHNQIPNVCTGECVNPILHVLLCGTRICASELMNVLNSVRG